MKRKHAQVTLFLILGVVVILIVIALFFTLSSQREGDLNTQTTIAQKVPTELNPFMTYMQTCIETVAKQGIFMLGEQGGYIYEGQGGNKREAPSSFFLAHEEITVPYRIKVSIGGGECMTQAPHYPVLNQQYPYTDLSTQATKYDEKGCFGKPILFSFNNSLDLSLVPYMEQQIKEQCTLDTFPQYEFDAAEPAVKVHPSAFKTIFTVIYPISITLPSIGRTEQVELFQAEVRIALKEIYEFANEIMIKDSTDPRYDIRTGIPSSGFSVSTHQNGNDDVVKIQSDTLKLDGKNFVLSFARENRPPALEYVSLTSISDKEVIKDEQVTWADLVLEPIKGVDPDEDTITSLVWLDRINGKVLPDTGYTFTLADVNRAPLQIEIGVSDGQYTDYQSQNIHEQFIIDVPQIP